MVNFITEENVETMQGTGGPIYEYFVITNGGNGELSATEIRRIEEDAGSAITQFTESDPEATEMRAWVEGRSSAADLIIEHRTDMLNVVVQEDMRQMLIDFIGTDKFPKLSQHFIISEDFAGMNFEIQRAPDITGAPSMG